MSEETNIPSGDDQNQASGQDDQVTDPSVNKNVGYDTHRQLLGEKKRVVERLRNAESELEALRREKEEAEKKRLESEKQFEQLYRQEVEKRKEFEEREKQRELEEIEATKYTAIVKALGGNAAINEKLFGPVIFSHDYLKDVIINPDTGQADEYATSKIAERIKAEFPEVLNLERRSRMPAQAPEGQTDGIDYNKWLKMNAADKRKHYKEVKEMERRKAALS